MYDYYMVQVPPTIVVKRKEDQSQIAAAYLQAVAVEQAARGWEFYRVDTIGVTVKPGCLAALFGQKNPIVHYYVVTFRRPHP